VNISCLQAELLKRAMSKPRQRLPEEVIELIASRFRALGEASRLKLIIAVEAGEKNVSQLAATTGLSQPNVSKHLQLLTNAGILVRRKEKMNVY
jgi:DNA-binding transcriptional ArsR family regulator